MARCPGLITAVLIALLGGIKWKCLKRTEGFCTEILSLSFLFMYHFALCIFIILQGYHSWITWAHITCSLLFCLAWLWYFHFTKYQFWFRARCPSVFLFKCLSLPLSRPSSLLWAFQFGIRWVLSTHSLNAHILTLWLRSVPSLVCSLPYVLQ